MIQPAPYPTYADPRAVPVNAGPMTRDEWVALHAYSWSVNWGNDTPDAFNNPFFANTSFDQRGLTHFGTSDRGVGQGGDATFTYGAAAQAAAYAFDNWDKLSPEERAAFLNPVGPDGKPLPDIPWVDPSLAIDAYEAETGRIEGEAYANNQNAQAAAALASVANDAQDIANRHAVGMAQVAADRERTASQERIAGADRAENARQFNEDLGFRRETLAENRRQFDLGLAEDRRQFNSTMLYNLLKTGSELAKQPVDWVAHQFYMANMGIPLGSLETVAAAMLMGAIPPSGPSASGPVVGGPAAMDGDTELAEAFGVQPGFVPLSQAVAQNPGTPVPGAEALTTPATAQSIVQSVGSLEAADAALAQAQAAELPTAVGDNPIVQQAVSNGTKYFQSPGVLAQAPLPQVSPTPPAADTGAPPLSVPGGGAPEPLPGIGGGPTNEPMAPVSMFGAPVAANADSGIFTGGPIQQAQTQEMQAAAQPSQAPVGIFGAQNPQGELLLQALANELGVPVEQVRQLVPPTMLAAGYSTEVLKQMPALQALTTGADRTGAEFRTAPVTDGQRFATIEALGIPLGIRSGQDINAGLLLKANNVNQQVMRGGIEGAGLDWATTVNQSLRASPVGQYDVGMFGRRRF